jgi:hypothetical protein
MRNQLPGLQCELEISGQRLAPAFQSFDLWRLVERMLNLNAREHLRIRLFRQTKAARSDLQRPQCFLTRKVWHRPAYAKRSLSPPPQQEKQDGNDHKDHDRTRPNKPSSITAISAHEHATGRIKQEEKQNKDSFHSHPFNSLCAP